MLKAEGYQLMGAAFEVYNQLGYGMAEEVYQQSLEIELGLRGIPFLSKPELEIFYKEKRPDQDEGPFLVEERTLLHVIAEQVGEIIELKLAEKDLATAREREIEIGSKIQKTLLLGSPPKNLSGIRIAANCFSVTGAANTAISAAPGFGEFGCDERNSMRIRVTCCFGKLILCGPRRCSKVPRTTGFSSPSR